jgi:hypothetical protein
MTGYVSTPEPEYDAFLYAPVYCDDQEVTLSVVSALVRLDVDPWQEAARLARLPKTAATTRLALLISRIPGGFPRNLDARVVADRLIGLLPSTAIPKIPLPKTFTVPSLAMVSHPRTILFVLFLIAILGLQHFVVDRSAVPLPAEGSSSTEQ